jgi:hypothetical protein
MWYPLHQNDTTMNDFDKVPYFLYLPHVVIP